MRREPKQRGLFEYRGQWIGEEPGRQGYYRYWYEVGSRRVKRKALIASDLGAAKDELIELLAGRQVSAQAPETVLLADALAYYIEHYATPKGYSQKAAARRAAQLALAGFTAIGYKSPVVADLTRTNQRKIWAHLASRYELTAKSITTYMISVRAAINWCAVPQVVTDEENKEEFEIHVLERSVTVFCNQEEVADKTGGSISKPREYIPTLAELGRWIDAISEEDDFRFVMIMLNTCARNEAIFDLDISKQVNWDFGTIDLNPIGRRQTKKRRPVLKMTTNLAAWFKHWGDDKPVRQYQDTVEKRLNKIGKPIVDKDGNVDAGLNMPEMTCYTLRHFIATNMRRASFTVSKEQRSLWLGHTVKEGSSTTDWYEKFDPDYLDQPMRATEEIIRKLQKHTSRKLFAPTSRSQGRLRVIK